jgi:hypothetical protein
MGNVSGDQSLDRRRSAGIVAGTVFAFNAHLLNRIPHLQAQHMEFLPAALFALDALLSKPSVRRGAACALGGPQATTSVYLLASTFFALAAAILSRPRDWTGLGSGRSRALAVATTVAAMVLVPFLLPYYHANQDLPASPDRCPTRGCIQPPGWTTCRRRHD